jgi:hypothetical protein
MERSHPSLSKGSRDLPTKIISSGTRLHKNRKYQKVVLKIENDKFIKGCSSNKRSE